MKYISLNKGAPIGALLLAVLALTPGCSAPDKFAPEAEPLSPIAAQLSELASMLHETRYTRLFRS